MIEQAKRDEHRDHGGKAQIATPTPALLRVRINESIRRRAAKADCVAMFEPLRPPNARAVNERAGLGFETSYVVAAARILDDRMPTRDVRIGDLQSATFGVADRRLIALQQQQSSARRIAIDRQQTRGLRSFQHLQQLSREAFDVVGHQKTNAVPFDVGVGGV
ncbi:MAG TPA: hypothetical protein VE243_01305, partial [Candidatus Acidoferrum sp.]|nr:hypothetical protein [Candidatus Acidoferrum sp.]